MQRLPEPELMLEESQAKAYAEADFDEPHSAFLQLFQEIFSGERITGYVLDLGCGPGDIALRFARAFPNCIIHGVDGSRAMLDYGKKILAQARDLQDRVELFEGLLPEPSLPRAKYDVIISNSLLHHLHEPRVLWRCIRAFAAPRALVFIKDLRRPKSIEKARLLMQRYAGNEPAVLQRDFYNSLLAAFEPAEVEEQLQEDDLSNFSVRIVSDRHLVISGRWPG